MLMLMCFFGSLLGWEPKDLGLWVWLLGYIGFHLGVSENRGTLFWGPYNKDPSV